jgi:hypothetical protein
MEGGRATGVRVQPKDGPPVTVNARVVVDASGQSALLQHRFKLRAWDPDPQQRRNLDLLGGSVPRQR